MAPQGDSEKDDSELGMGPEERRQIFNAGLEIPGDTEAIEPADDSMDFYTGDHKHSKKKDDSDSKKHSKKKDGLLSSA